MLGFEALGKLALGQLPQRFTNLFFSLWSQPQPTKVSPQSFTGFVSVPVITPVVFSSFSQPTKVKVNQSEVTFRIPIPVVAPTPVFTRFSEPSFSKVRQQSNTNSSFFVQPITTVVVGGDFADFDLIQSKKALQQHSWNFISVPRVQNYVFSSFNQPQTKKILQQDQSFVNLPVITVTVQPYVFGQFDQPLNKRIQQADSSFVNLPIVVIPPVNFTGFIESIPQQKRFIDGFITSIIPSFIQAYVFSPFSQPQVKKQLNDQFTWFPGTFVPQSYVFSSFSQPLGVKYQLDSQRFVEYPFIIVPPPVFTGFNDFGLTQQLIGTQKNQDGATVQFSVLPMPQVVSVYNFTGFSDFPVILAKIIRQQSDIDYQIFTPSIPFPDVAIGGGKRIPKIPKVDSVESSNIAEIAYDEDFGELGVKFKNDKIYRYTNVSPKRAKGLIKAKSHGKYLHRNIIGKYPTTRIK